FDENVAVLARWDKLNSGFLPQGRRVVGIAGNDSHQNVGIRIVATKDGLEIRNALDRVIGSVPDSKVQKFLLGPLTPGATVRSQTFDPYEVSLHYVSTHLLAPAVSEEALMEAMRKGRAYVAFDWMADPSGFRYFAAAGQQTIEMGGDVPAVDNP